MLPAFPSEAARLLAIAIEGACMKAIAWQLGITPQFLGMLARGQRRPSLDVAIRIAHVLKIDATAWETKLPVSTEAMQSASG
jgi:transcriptional regulator with XRE-family HTH domain